MKPNWHCFKCPIKTRDVSKGASLLKRKQSLIKLIFTGTFCLFLLTGCSVQNFALQNVGNLLSKESVSTDDDLELLKHASAYHLKLSESILQEIPDHVQLAESLTRGYAQYAYVFLMDEADRTESDSVQKAIFLRNRAAKMLGRAKDTGLKTLSLYYPGLLDQLGGKPNAKPLVISQNHVGLTYWSMTAWAGAISLSKDSPDVVADLPAVIKLSELAWKANPKYDHGALASMMGTLELSKPGGNAGTAQKYYDLAIQWRGDQIAPLVAKAENWAVATQNKEAFVQLLQQAIVLSEKQKDLTNTVMGRRARWLLDNVDNYF
jgi:hypothetical protein